MSKEKAYSLYIEDILDAIEAIFNFTKEISLEEFSSNDLVYSAVCRKLEIIGEASNRINNHLQEKYNQIPWKEITGLRNIIIHNYDRIRPEIIWDVIIQDLKVIVPLLKDMLIDLEQK